jgi:hypothetical protein
LSDLTAIRQKHSETVPEYLQKFRETRDKCYNLTIGEKDLTDLAFAGLSSYLREKMEGQELMDVNQVRRGLWHIRIALRIIDPIAGSRKAMRGREKRTM